MIQTPPTPPTHPKHVNEWCRKSRGRDTPGGGGNVREEGFNKDRADDVMG